MSTHSLQRFPSYLTVLVLLLTLVFVMPAEVSAQCDVADACTIVYGADAFETLESGTIDEWSLEGETGDIVYILLEGGFDTYLELVAPDGKIVAFDDDSAGFANALIDRFVLPQTGTYTIIARGTESSQSGSYMISVALLGQAPANSNSSSNNSSSNSSTSSANAGAADEEVTDVEQPLLVSSLQSSSAVSISDSITDSLTQTVVANNFDVSIQIPEGWESGSNTPWDFVVSNNLPEAQEVTVVIEFNTDAMFGIDNEQEAANAIFQGLDNFAPVSINDEVLYLAEIDLSGLSGVAAIKFLREGYYIAIFGGTVSSQTWEDNEELVYAIISSISIATPEELSDHADEIIESEITLTESQSINGFTVNLPEGASVGNGDILSFAQTVAGIGIPYTISTSDGLGLQGTSTLRIWRFGDNMSRFINALQLATAYTLTTSDLDFEFVVLGDVPALIMSVEGMPNVYGVVLNVDNLNFAVVLETQDEITEAVQDTINQIAQSISIP